jgi:hypothetical protein
MTTAERVKQVETLMQRNPYGDAEMLQIEIDEFKLLAEDEQEVYLKELTELATIYKWNAQKMPKGSFYGVL